MLRRSQLFFSVCMWSVRCKTTHVPLLKISILKFFTQTKEASRVSFYWVDEHSASNVSKSTDISVALETLKPGDISMLLRAEGFFRNEARYRKIVAALRKITPSVRRNAGQSETKERPSFQESNGDFWFAASADRSRQRVT